MTYDRHARPHSTVTPPQPGATKSARGEHGFTLMELLVSTTVLALVMGLVAASVQVMSAGWERGGAAAMTYDMIGRAGHVITRDLQRIRRAIVMTGKKPLFMFAGTATTMTFVVQEPPYPTAPGLYVIRLAIDSVGTGERLMRARRPYDHALSIGILDTPSQSADFRDRVTLIEGPFQPRFQYFNGATWRDDWTDRSQMPTHVKLRFSATPAAMPIPDIVTELAVNAEPGCVAKGSGACTIQSNGKLPETIEKQEPEKQEPEKPDAAKKTDKDPEPRGGER